jgi:uncharacterized protein (TIRG00374 family)
MSQRLSGFVRQIALFGRGHALAIWLIVIPLLVAFVVARQWDEVGRIGEALRTAHPHWIVIGIGIETVTIIVTALTYQILLRRLGHRLSCLTLASVHLQRVSLGTIFLVSGPASLYAFLRILNRRQVPTEDGLLTSGLRSLAGHGAFLILLVTGLMIQGSPYAMVVAGLIVVLVIALTVLTRRRPRRSWQGRPYWLRRLPSRVARWVVEFRVRLRRHQLHLRDLAWPVVLALIGRAGPVGLLFVSLRALGIDASLPTVVTAYFAAVFAHAMVPVLQGTGAVEAATALALRHHGVPAEMAISVVLLWRLIDFWLPFAAGLVAAMTPWVAKGAEEAAPSFKGAASSLAWRPAPTPAPAPVVTAVMPPTVRHRSGLAPDEL